MSGSCFFNGKDFSECGKSRGRTELVRLVECQDDTTIHLRTHHLSSDKLSEWQLIVARTGLFNLEKGQTDQMWICPKHRYDLGKGWRKSKTVCQYPKHSGETTRKKKAKGRNSVSIQLAKDIQMLFGVLVPVGSREYL